MKKGFTLIELLAVIIVLAVISTIAVPIVMNIINNSTRSTNEASIELYGRAVEQATLEYELVNKTIATSYEDIKDYINYDGNKVECDTFSVEGSKVYLSECSVDDELVNDYEYGEIDVCALLSGKPNEIGSKYLCRVNETEKYNFYVLSHELDETTNLIMDRNICEDGTPTDANKTDKCKVEWYALAESDTTYGPVTAMDHIYNATKDWSNIPNIQMNYNDEEDNLTSGYGYGIIKTENNITKIIKRDGTTASATYTNLKARMPYYSEVTEEGCESGVIGSCPVYLIDYLYDASDVVGHPYQENIISGIDGYWLISSYSEASAWAIHTVGGLFSASTNDTAYGVRPVINVKL